MGKLSAQQVDEIRWLRVLGRTDQEIARYYGIDRRSVRRIVRGKRHGDVSPMH